MTRQVVSGSPHREVGVINPKWLLDHPVHHESHLERRFAMVALACPVVTDIVHQPLTMTFENGRTYTPDFKLTYYDKEEVYIEVKPEIFVLEHEEKLVAASLAFAKRGNKFLVVTDREIDKNGLGKKAILLMRYARIHIDPEQTSEFISLIESTAKTSHQVRELIEIGLSDAEVWNLVARHKLRIPAGLWMDDSTEVSINKKGGNCHDQLLAWFGIEAR